NSIFLRVSEKMELTFLKLLSSLIIWQNMGFLDMTVPSPTTTNYSTQKNLLVCRFKVYGPIPKQKKSMEIFNSESNIIYPNDPSKVHEGWFYSMGVLKLDGVLDLLSESDGTLLYSINIKALLSSEIRQINHSIFQSSNILYIGIIKKLRSDYFNKSNKPFININDISIDTPSSPFFIQNSKHKFNELKHCTNQRIILDFDLHIDFEDWFVALLSLTSREYVGMHSSYNKSNSLRLSKKIKIDVIEATFNSNLQKSLKQIGFLGIYTAIHFWNCTWARSSVVKSSKSPFWREEFDVDAPLSWESFEILIKACLKSDDSDDSKNFKLKKTFLNFNPKEQSQYNFNDLLIGKVKITKTIIKDSNNNGEIWIPIYNYYGNKVKVGQICIRISLNELFILSPTNYLKLESLLLQLPFKKLINFFKSNKLVDGMENLEENSSMLLDIFQSLNIEDKWFSSLIEEELNDLQSIFNKASSNQHSKSTENDVLMKTASANCFNTLFRGNSILTKSIEKYNFRIGQEYLEKTIGKIVLKVSNQGLNCEIDPNRIYEKNALMRDAILKSNFNNLLKYMEETWKTIYSSSADLPHPIKYEMKIFRDKFEESCGNLEKELAYQLILNCTTGFIFLRFFCPALLNPKLFLLAKDHQVGSNKRTLTLIAKILLTFSNRGRFGAKEPWLIPMNQFIEKHELELKDYMDKITNRKPETFKKHLDLSDTVIRPEINIQDQELAKELPSNPFLIDKYLRMTQFSSLI
ncbi:GTPase-activating protein BUD2, partial [Ascoidea rubescens DSM 1968]